MKKVIIPAAILCTAICIGVNTQWQEAERPITTPEPPTVEVVVMPTPIPEVKIEIAEPEVEEPIGEVVVPETQPIPESVIQQPVTNQSVQAGDMAYVPGFGWIEIQGEGTVTYDENMRENGNKVGIMG